MRGMRRRRRYYYIQYKRRTPRGPALRWMRKLWHGPGSMGSAQALMNRPGYVAPGQSVDEAYRKWNMKLVRSRKLQATSPKLQATSVKLQAASAPEASSKRQAPSYKHRCPKPQARGSRPPHKVSGFGDRGPRLRWTCWLDAWYGRLFDAVRTIPFYLLLLSTPL